VPILGPLVGAAVGALLYDGLIRTVLRARAIAPDPAVSEQGRPAVD
jgi:hypothetical protein